MKSSKQITQYLEEVAQEMLHLGVTTSFHLLVAGGAYMLLLKKRDFTLDIDFALVENPPARIPRNKVIRIRVTKAEIAGATSSVPYHPGKLHRRKRQ